MELEVVAPDDVAIFKTPFPEIGWFEIFVILWVRVTADKRTDVNATRDTVTEDQKHGYVIVARRFCYGYIIVHFTASF